MMLSAITAQDAAVAESEGLSGASGSVEQAFATGPSLIYLYVKRGLDLIIASVVLLAMIPLIVLVALAIWLDDRGPVFYRQERVGTRGRRQGWRIKWEERQFRILKFRTM